MHEQQLSQTREWVEQFVVQLNLCPFAGAVAQKNGIRYRMSTATNIDVLYDEFLQELLFLHEQPVEEVETTLLIHPQVLQDFDAYLDFLDLANEILEKAGLEGEIQVASFHPDYCFAGEDPTDPANFSNRSPYPMLHLLREESVSKAVDQHPNIEGIPERNIALLREMGVEKIKTYYPQ